MQLSSDHVAAIRGWAEHRPTVTAVFVFGSRARDEAAPNADVDLSLAMVGRREGLKQRAPIEVFRANNYAWEQELGRLVGLDVHLQMFDPITHPNTYPEVVRYGIKLWERP